MLLLLLLLLFSPIAVLKKHTNEEVDCAREKETEADEKKTQ
jgi:hypothetical protein